MEIPHLHDWDIEYAEARELQDELAPELKFRPLSDDIRLVAGADVAYSRKAGKCFASVVLMEIPELEPLETYSLAADSDFPYIPGLLSFREAPVVLETFRKLDRAPEAVIFDGQGYAHPRRMGLASHLGLWLDIPTVGCAKSRLVGEHEEPGEEKGQWTDLTDDGEKIGEVVRTRTSVKPVFVSPGHLSDFQSARRLVLRCCSRYRLPEPTRQADLCVARAKKRYLSGEEI